MPALTDLDHRLAGNAEQNASFQRNESQARQVAADMPLVHVSGKGVPFDALLTQPPHEIPTSSHPTYCSDATRRAESLLGLAPSAYFYAGRACPDFGDVALAFGPSCDARHTVSVTPFDTGGLVHEKRFIRCNLNGPNDEAALVDFAKASEIPGAAWRDDFARFLSAYFDPLTDYWEGRPAYDDTEGLFTLAANSFRAWTFEVRFAEGHSVLDRVAWVADKRVMDSLRQRQHEQPVAVPGEPETVLDQFLKQPPLNPDGSNLFCEELESWVRTQVSL